MHWYVGIISVLNKSHQINYILWSFHVNFSFLHTLNNKYSIFLHHRQEKRQGFVQIFSHCCLLQWINLIIKDITHTMQERSLYVSYFLNLPFIPPLISAVKQMWGLCSSPPTPPPSPHAIKLFKCLCFSVRLWVLCVCLLRVCVFMFLTVCCRHSEPSKKRNIAEVCFGKSKRKLTAEGGGKLKCCFFSLSLLWLHWVSLITLLVQFWLHAKAEGIPLQCRL